MLANRSIPSVDDRLQATIEPETPVLLSDHVDHRQATLALCVPESAAQLLAQDGRALRRPQKQDRVHVGNVHSLAENVDAKDNLEVATREALERIIAVVVGGRARDRNRWKPSGLKLLRHVARVLDRDTKSERPHPSPIRDPLDRREKAHHPPVVCRVQALELGVAIAAPAPVEPREVRAVRDPEVLEGHEIALVNRLPESELNRDPATEPLRDVLLVHPLRSRGQPE